MFQRKPDLCHIDIKKVDNPRDAMVLPYDVPPLLILGQLGQRLCSVQLQVLIGVGQDPHLQEQEKEQEGLQVTAGTRELACCRRSRIKCRSSRFESPTISSIPPICVIAFLMSG